MIEPESRSTQEEPDLIRSNFSQIPNLSNIGFVETSGLDYQDFPESPLGSGNQRKIEQIVDNTRLERIIKYLKDIAVVASDPEIKATTLKVIDQQIEYVQKENLGELYDILALIRRVIASFTNEPALKLVLKNGASDRTQDLIVKEGHGLGVYLKNEELLTAAVSALELIKERYAQEHGGRAYQTVEQKKALDEAKTRSEKANIQ